jgi:hypothetical protein
MVFINPFAGQVKRRIIAHRMAWELPSQVDAFPVNSPATKEKFDRKASNQMTGARDGWKWMPRVQVQEFLC